MKKLVFATLLLSVLVTTTTFAQPRKGYWMVGANVVPVQPRAGYFVSDKLLLGAGLNVNVGGSPGNNVFSASLGFAPFAKYYFSGKEGLSARKFFFYLEANTSINYSFGYNDLGFRDNRPSYQAGLGPGLEYFVNDRVSVNGGITLNAYNIGEPNTNLSLFSWYSFGVQIYLKGKKNKSEEE